MRKMIKPTLAIASIATILSGCATMKKNEAAADASIKKTQAIYKKMQIKQPDSLVSQSDQVYLAGNAFKIEQKEVLPPVFSKTITYTTANNETPVQTLEYIGKMLDISIRLTDDAKKIILADKNLVDAKSYQGKFEKILNQIATKTGLFWTYKDGKVKIFSVETKVYSLDAPISDFSVKNNISSSTDTSSDDSDSATDGTTSVSMDSTTKADSAWNSAIATIKNMLSPVGKLDTNPVEGYVTVTDNPERQREIRQYIKKINDKTNKKIAIRVDVYNVNTDDSSQHGIDINAVTDALDGSVQWTSSTVANTTGDAASTLTFSDGGNHSVVLSALNTIGKTSQTTGTTVYTISGQPAPIQNSIQQNYLRSISTSTTNDSTTTSMEPGTITTGYNMTVTPRIASNNEILVSLNLQISNLVNLETFSVTPSSDGDSSESQQIQLPTIHTKSFFENMILKSGQTILIAGFQDDTAGANTNSLGDPQYWQLGGSKTTSHTKTTTVVVVTPYIIGK